jgi:flagellar biosynthetic protein FliP
MNRESSRFLKIILRGLVFCGLLVSVGGLFAQDAVVEQADGDALKTLTGLDGENLGVPLRALALVTVFGVVPSIVLLTTCFPRILVVLFFLRKALGTQDLPPNMLVFGLSFLLTGAVMFPTWQEVHQEAYIPLVETKEINAETALQKAELPVKRFMLRHTLRDDLRLMLGVSAQGAGKTSFPTPDDREPSGSAPGTSASQQLEELSFFTILPAFVLSELKIAFQLGFLLFLPFLLIDLVVSAVLVSMGMIMLPPTLVSLPLKILVFVLVDGWSLVVSQLLAGIQGGG